MLAAAAAAAALPTKGDPRGCSDVPINKRIISFAYAKKLSGNKLLVNAQPIQLTPAERDVM